LVGAVTNKVSTPAALWVIGGLCVWIGSLLFAAFGLFTGYLLASENVTQVIGLAIFVAGETWSLRRDTARV
jgi:ABC-2 type transport system permease protein